MDVKAVKEKYRNRLLSLPNVVALGIGPKMRGGRPTGEISIKVFVSQKLKRDELGESDCVPAVLDGIPTDVEAHGPSKKY